MKTMNEKMARKLGYHAVTSGYKLPDEEWMLDNVRGDLQRGNISHALVKVNGGTAIWRTFRSGTCGRNGRAA